MTLFTFHAPTRVRFGDGARHALPEMVDVGRWGVLSSPTVLARSGISEALDACRRRGIQIVDLGTVSPNPRLGEVERAVEIARGADVVGVIAAGGGSVMDAAKLLRVALQHGASARETLDNLAEVVARPLRARVPLLAVPTTAGTGAEVSRGAIITDESTGAKRPVRGEALVPDVAIVDPELTLSLSRRRTAETGFDIIAHAVETFLSRAATPITDILALAALQEVPGALLRAVADAADIAARRVLSLHAWLMGYNLAHASTCLPHRMQYPIGAATDTSHQIGLAAVYPAWLRHVAAVARERAVVVSGSIAGALRPDGAEAPLAVQDAVARYLERLGMRVGLVDLGLTETDVEALTSAVSGRVDLDPLQPDRAMIAAIYAESLRV